MNAREWLRRKAAADVVHIETMPTAPTEVQPIAVVKISGVVSRASEEAIRKALTVSPRPWRDEAVACGCWPRYSECRCRRAA